MLKKEGRGSTQWTSKRFMLVIKYGKNVSKMFFCYVLNVKFQSRALEGLIPNLKKNQKFLYIKKKQLKKTKKRAVTKLN